MSTVVRSGSPQLTLGAPFARALATFLRAYQLQAAVAWSMRLLAFGLALDLLALVTQRALPRFDLPLPLLAVPPLLGALVGAVLGASRRPSASWLAAEVDRRLGLHERTLTALELLGRAGRWDAIPLRLGVDQIEDSIDHLRRAEPMEAFPLRVPRREAIAAGVLALALAPMILLGPAARRDATGPRIDALARGEAERITALAEELEQDAIEDPESVNASAGSLLRQVAEQLREAQNDADRAMAQLGDGERRLSSLQRPGALDASQALSRLADALDREALTREAAAALDRRDYRQAAQEMRNIAQRAAQGSEADRQAIARAMQQGAAGASRYDERLAQALQQAAEAASRGETGATERAAQEMARAGGESNRQETLERAMSQLQNSRQALGSSGQRGSQSQGQRQPGGSPGQGERSNERGEGQGQGQGQGEGQGDQPGEGQGQGQGDRPGEGQGSGAGTGSQGRTSDVYNPASVRSRQVQVPGGDFDRPQVTEGDPTDGADGEARVDYRDVLPTYQERATKAMQDRYIPLGMKDLVRDYFSSLQPGQTGAGR